MQAAWMAALIALAVMPTSQAFAGNDDSANLSAQRRTRVTIYPRHVEPGPNAVRHCDAWLQKEYRVSGPVVTPQMRCVWR